MFMPVPDEPRMQDVTEASRRSIKCRIPQRLPLSRIKPPLNNVSRPKCEPAKQKFEVVTTQHSRFVAKNSARLRGDEQPQPKLANRFKDDKSTGRPTQFTTRLSRIDKCSFIPKGPRTPIMTSNEHAVNSNKSARPRPLITVPVTQGPPRKNVHICKNYSTLPDQETIKQDEDLELNQSEIGDVTRIMQDSITSRSDILMQLKINWQEKSVQFQKMKEELTERQNAILEFYAVMHSTHQKMMSYGEKAHLPSAEDLRIMNVTKMTPEQLLQLCTTSGGIPQSQGRLDSQAICKSAYAIDVQKLYDMPSKLVDTCEQTLLKRKEIIDWFDTLKSQDKGISVHKLSKKVNEFNAENEMLKSSLEQVKAEFVKEFEGIVNFLRKSVNETVALQLRSEEMTYELSELNSQNADFRKRIHNAENTRLNSNKARIEELQKELKEEKCKRIFMRDRISRADGQVKMNQERAAQLEAALEQARSQTWTLERTVQQANEQNHKLQNDFDKELSTLTESIRENTVHLEEIADDREKLQTEKEDLENRLAELADHYNGSLKEVKHEMNVNVVKLIETEKKYECEVECSTKLAVEVEALRAQLLQAEERLKDATKQIQENENKIDKTMNAQRELEIAKQNLHDAHLEINNYKNGLTAQNEVIAEIERRYTESFSMQRTLKCDITTKEEYIAELEKKQLLQEQQLRENERKMETYVEQLTSLKSQITKLQDDFGDFENLNELHEKINHQRAQLLEATRQNDELAEGLQKKEEEIEQLLSGLAEQESSIEQREQIISEKEEEQTNIIKILRNNLELRSQEENNLNQQLAEKNNEIDALFTDMDMGKKQMSNLEKIILSLQEQTRKSSIQRKKDQDKIAMLQSKLDEYEAYHIETSRINAPVENLDNLIKIIEDELGTPIEPHVNSNDHEYMSNKKHAGDRKRDKLEFHEEHNTNAPLYQQRTGKYPAKIVMGNFVKKTYIPANEKQYECDNLDRKRAITNMDTQQWLTAADANNYNPPATRDTNLLNLKEIVPGEHQNQSYLTRTLQYMSPNQYRDDRKYKMYKLAGHRL